MKYLNRIRMQAGLPIDPSIEITEKKQKVVENQQLNEADTAGPMDDFWLVLPATSTSSLKDVLHRTNKNGLIHAVMGHVGDRKDIDPEEIVVFAGSNKTPAEKLAKKRIREVAKMAQEEEELAVSAELERMQHEEEEFEQATKLADCDYDGDGEIETPEQEYKGSRDKAIDKKMIKQAKQEIKTANKVEPESMSEAMQSYVNVNKETDSFEDDEEDPINVVTKDNKEHSHDSKTKQDKNESPTQLKALDTPSEQDQSGGGDTDRKVKVPSNVITSLKKEADRARKDAKNLNVSNKEASMFYDDLARAFDDLRNHLEGGTVYDLKQAQIFMTSLMGPMLHKIPADVVQFVAQGGVRRSLKNYMTKVDDKYPITGPRNALK